MKRLLLAAAGVAAALAACTDVPSSPGKCPDFCPADSILVVDTVLDAVRADSAFRGYVTPDNAPALLAVTIPGSPDSRPIFRMLAVPSRFQPFSSDTTTQPWAPERARVVLTIARRDTASRNLRVSLFRLPDATDSTATFTDVQSYFTDSLLRTVNVDSLLALPAGYDSATGDSVVVLPDSASHAVLLYVGLDSAALPYDPVDSGQVSLGIRVSADTLAYAVFGSLEGGAAAQINWYQTVDSSGTPVVRRQGARARWDTFVTDSPPPGIDSVLAVGGMPAARSIMRFALPRAIAESAQVVRATLVLVPESPPAWAPGDSIGLMASRVLADFGAKSPLAVPTQVGDSTAEVARLVATGATDTVTIEVTPIVRFWQVDTLAPRALMLTEPPEGGSFSEMRFFSTRTPAYRPALHLTYVPRYTYGAP